MAFIKSDYINTGEAKNNKLQENIFSFASLCFWFNYVKISVK